MGMKIDVDEIRGAQEALIARRTEIERELQALRDETSALESAIQDYETALKIFYRHEAKAAGNDSEDGNEDGAAGHGELRRLIEGALHTAAKDGASVTEIREFIRMRHGRDIQPNTISVTLNRLKNRQLAHLTGAQWFPGPGVEMFWDDSKPSGNKHAADLDDDIPF